MPTEAEPTTSSEPAAGGAAPASRWAVRLLAGLTLGLGFLLLGLLGSTRADAQAPAEEVAAKIVDFGFEPGVVEVAVGSKVTWTNTGARPHTVTDRGGTFDTQPIAPKATGSVTFTVPGRYFVFCRINPKKMNGIVVVEPAATPAKVVRVQTVDPGNIEGETLRFDPPELTVPAGTTLLVANVGGKPHTLTADDNAFTTPVITPGPEGGRFAGSNATVTLTTPGTFPFHCEVHPQAMKGTITVTGDATGDATGGADAAAPPATAPAPSEAGPQKASVDIVDFEFSVKQLSVAPGAEVTFSNKGDAPHTATLDDVEGADTGTIESGGSAVLQAPAEPGSYSYRCNIHTSMRAVLVVLGQQVADPTEGTVAPSAAAEEVTAPDTADPTVPAPVYDLGGSDRGGMATAALVTGVAGGFLGGAGVMAFVLRAARTRRRDDGDD